MVLTETINRKHVRERGTYEDLTSTRIHIIRYYGSTKPVKNIIIPYCTRNSVQNRKNCDNDPSFRPEDFLYWWRGLRFLIAIRPSETWSRKTRQYNIVNRTLNIRVLTLHQRTRSQRFQMWRHRGWWWLMTTDSIDFLYVLLRDHSNGNF